MNESERDQLLARLDERTANIYNLVETQEKHLSKLNDSVAKNTTDCAKHKIGIRNIWFVIGVLVVALVIKIVGVV